MLRRESYSVARADEAAKIAGQPFISARNVVLSVAITIKLTTAPTSDFIEVNVCPAEAKARKRKYGKARQENTLRLAIWFALAARDLLFPSSRAKIA
jgi:hypothetical protein